MPNNQNRKLAAILFADIVGYTSLMQKDEAHANILLGKFHNTINTKVENHKGRVINNYGDGCVCTFDSAVSAVQCAKEVQQFFQNEPKVPVRIGLHSGDVFFKENNVYGDSVNIASRIESLGVAGAILFSKRIKRHISNQKEFEVQSLGEFDFKNVEKSMEVFALANEGFAIPKREEMKGKVKSISTKKNKFLIPIIVGALLLFVFGFWKYNTANPSNSSNENISSNSIAVLPFTNMSDEKENQYFTDGMHDDLLTHLSKIGSMKVISRTSVLRFKDTQQPIPEIAKMLEVANILEGSVRRAGNQVRINVQLIKAETDEHLWSEIYDRELTTTNIFDIQTEISKAIASALQTNISSQEQKALEELPTENLEAYEAYLKARQLIEVRNLESLREAKSLLEKAIALDSEFALAYIHLGGVYSLIRFNGGMDTDTALKLAKENLEKGMQLNDNLAEGYALKGYLIGYIENDLEKATIAFEKAISINPNYARTYHWYALTVRRFSRDSERAFEIHKKAVRLNPLSPVILQNLAEYQTINRDFNAAKKTLQKGMSIESAYPLFWNRLSRNYAYEGKLDSSAICTFEGIQNNKASGSYLRYYLLDLNKLGMVTELEDELNSIIPETREDSITVLWFTIWKYEDQKNFDAYLQLVQQTTMLSDAQKNRMTSNVAWLKRDYQQVIQFYEKSYPNLEDGNHLSALDLSGFSDFQEYIFCLKKVGQEQRADSLWSKFQSMILVKSEGQFEWLGEEKRRLKYNIRYQIMEGNLNKAIPLIEKYFENDYVVEWQDFEIEPIFDAIQSHPDFIKIMKRVKEKVAEQSENVRVFLRGKNGKKQK